MKKLLIAISLILTLSLIIPVASCARVGSKIAEDAIEKALEKSSGGNVDLNLEEGGAVVKDEKGGWYYDMAKGTIEANLPEKAYK